MTNKSVERTGMWARLIRRLRRPSASAASEKKEQAPTEDKALASSRSLNQRRGFLSRPQTSVSDTWPREERVRPLWIGVDYGTSTSKLVMTDYGSVEGTRSFPVRPPASQGGNGEYRIPSTVSLDSECIRIGFNAESRADAGDRVYRSLKMLCAYPDRFYGDAVDLPSELNARDLATLFVGHLVQLGQRAAVRYAASFDAKPAFGITLGAPMAQIDDHELHRMFVEIAREAFQMKDQVDLLGRISVQTAVAALASVREQLAGTEAAEPRDWVRSEAEAALFWAHSAPDIPDGRYSCVDVGAGTTSASWFHINPLRIEDDIVKGRLSFYGTACAPPGCDLLDAIIAKDIGLLARVEARGQENEALARLSDAARAKVDDGLDEIAEVYGLASQEAYTKQKSIVAWQGIGQLFLLGGGSKIAPVRERLMKRMEAWLQPSSVAEPGVPADLVEEDGDTLHEDPTFLLVAYGLSRRLADVPEIDLPSEVEPFAPSYQKKERPYHGDLYS